MMAGLAAMMRFLVAILCVVSFFASVMAGFAVQVETASITLALLAAGGGICMTVLVFGTIAILFNISDTLERIADRPADSGDTRPANPWRQEPKITKN